MSTIPSQNHLGGVSMTQSPSQWGAIGECIDTSNRVYATLSNIGEGDFLYEIHDCVDNIKTMIIKFHLDIRNTVKNQEILDSLHEILRPLEETLLYIGEILSFLDVQKHVPFSNGDITADKLKALLTNGLIGFEIGLLRLIRPDNRASMLSELARDLRIEIKKTRKAFTQSLIAN